ncbi:MAG TPA: HIT domain-containing protein [Acidimicrobiales bacterium]|nr:HIT domain-containing protein [Acidimicrobiales bacterium]
MPLDRFSAAWREGYVSSVSTGDSAHATGECVFCVLADQFVDESTGVLWRSELTYVTLNAFPYGSGHLLVLPRRHVASLGDLSNEEYSDFTRAIRSTTVALEKAYGPDGMNVGMNLGQAAGAGIPKHLHGHVLPRWFGDTNFMTSIGETRVLPESLQSTWQKVHVYL